MQNAIDRSDFNLLIDRLKEIYSKTDILHINVIKKRKNIKDVKVKIKGIYINFMCVSSNINGYEESFTISYIDILIKNVVIQEIEI